MLGWALGFLVVALIAGCSDFTVWRLRREYRSDPVLYLPGLSW